MGKSLNGKELGSAIYQRPNGSYEARYIDRFGKQRSVYAKTVTEVCKKQREKMFESEKQINIIDNKMTLDEWYDKWISVCKTHCRETTKRTYAIQYNRIRDTLGWRKLTGLNLVVLQDAFNCLGSDKSRRDCKALLVDILNRAVEADLLLKNPALGINPVIDGKTKSEKRILSREESEMLLENSKDGMMYPIFVVALGTGMRMGEILGLTWNNIDFDKRIIEVEKTLAYLPGDGLRHTFATNCIENGMEPKVLQKIMGHNSLQMTMDLYCHVREATLKDEMAKIAAFM